MPFLRAGGDGGEGIRLRVCGMGEECVVGANASLEGFELELGGEAPGGGQGERLGFGGGRVHLGEPGCGLCEFGLGGPDGLPGFGQPVLADGRSCAWGPGALGQIDGLDGEGFGL